MHEEILLALFHPCNGLLDQTTQETRNARLINKAIKVSYSGKDREREKGSGRQRKIRYPASALRDCRLGYASRAHRGDGIAKADGSEIDSKCNLQI